LVERQFLQVREPSSLRQKQDVIGENHEEGVLPLIVTALASAAAAQGGGGPVFPPYGFDVTAVDRMTKPGDDFFQYADGAYLPRLWARISPISAA
jgi:hypothetical protein